jgi:hypothetical protein
VRTTTSLGPTATVVLNWDEEGILDWWCTEHEEAFSEVVRSLVEL